MKTAAKIFRKLCTHIGLLMVAIVALFPILYVVAASFRTNAEFFANVLPFSIRTLLPIEWTWDNYVAIFKEFNFLQPIINTFTVVAVVVPTNIFICSIAAFAFAFFNFKGKKALFALFIVSFMVPTDAVALPLYQLVNSWGIVDTKWALILPSLCDGLVLFLFTQAFKDIPASFIEAARIDGANWGQIYTRIVMPLSLSILLTAGLMIFVNEWNAYMWPLLVARSESVRTVQLAISYFNEEFVRRWSYIFAASTISALVPIFLFLPFQKYYVQGITSGGIKG